MHAPTWSGSPKSTFLAYFARSEKSGAIDVLLVVPTVQKLVYHAYTKRLHLQGEKRRENTI